jgi:hypothetical protein
MVSHEKFIVTTTNYDDMVVDTKYLAEKAKSSAALMWYMQWWVHCRGRLY